MFKENDKVVIKTTKELEEDSNIIKTRNMGFFYRNPTIARFERRMTKYCGKTATIKKVLEMSGQKFYILDVDGEHFAWQDWMIKLVNKQLELF